MLYVTSNGAVIFYVRDCSVTIAGNFMTQYFFFVYFLLLFLMFLFIYSEIRSSVHYIKIPIRCQLISSSQLYHNIIPIQLFFFTLHNKKR